ncbi:cation:proton antiporter [Microcoleus sp. FACHB-68]|uniref:cation:proton antiporter domain-containing protein n=1 Tax=Microcoleus sp. FACHB-68 TaxID=2692826 RepID=UPI001689A9A0|nr:cation:proton antiporter [Microcoleus sp. FACHB-68]MBD1939970.1 cation:proton antiporter [Microcoleus sp. FACHB-68]
MEHLSEVLKEPIVPFAILLVVILTVPIVFERFRIPGLVGLLAAGVLLGQNGLKLLDTDLPTMKLLSDIGLLYLMFVAGLEVDIHQFRKKKDRSIGFGSLTFIVPLIAGTVVGRVFGFGWNASILIGSLLASHTLLAYPIVSRLGVVANEAVIVTIGATIFTDVGALLVLAVCVAVKAGSFTVFQLVTLLVSLLIYSAVVLFGFDWAGREFFRRTGDEEGNQFLFVLLAVFLASLGAQLIGVEKIIGAFLAGLAVNDVVGEGPVKEKVVFVGSVLFIPIFFVDLGLLIDVPAFIKSILSVWMPLTIVGALIGSKFLAAFFASLIYRYNRQEMLTMWSLSLPQVGATLAATLVGVRAGLLTEDVLNSVIVLMLATATLGPVITSRVAPGLSTTTQSLETEPIPQTWGTQVADTDFTVVVPVYNPQTEQYLVEMAAILARHEAGRIVPLAITTAHAHMDAPQIETAIERCQTLLNRATELGGEMGVKAEPLLRIDYAIDHGISHASREQNANLIVMGWGKQPGFRTRLLGSVIDSVLSSSHCPVAVTRLLDSPLKIRRILVPIESLSDRAMQALRFARILAEANQAQITLLHVCDRRTPASKKAWIESQLSLLVSKWVSLAKVELDIQVIPHADVVKAILNAAESVDLVVWRSQRYRTAAGLAVSDVTTQMLRQLTCSLVMFGEPQRVNTDIVLNSVPKNKNVSG